MVGKATADAAGASARPPAFGARLRVVVGERFWARLSLAERCLVGLFGCVILLTVIGPALAPHSPITADASRRLLPPGGAFLFGTDENGIDVFSRLLAAPRTDVTVAVIATLISVLIGAPLGIITGYFEGTTGKGMRLVSELVLRVLDILQAFPVFILAMVLVAIRGTGPVNVVFAIAFVNFPVFLRLARSEVLSLRERPFAEAAFAIGNSDLGVCFKHLLPNTWPTILTQLSVTVGFGVLLTSGLSFVGAGVSPPTPELGSMIASGAKFMILGQWWVAMFPGVMLGVIVFSFATMGELATRLIGPGQGRAPSRRRALAPLAAGVAARAPGATPARALLSVRDLSVASGDGRPILDKVALELERGEILGVVGAPGSGKSVLVRAIVGLLGEGLHRAGGEILFQERDLARLERRELNTIRGRTLVPVLANAKNQLNPLVRIGELMTAHIRAHDRCTARAARERAAKMLGTIGITDPGRRLQAYPHELSGGMAQRVCIAIALMHRPPLIVADEPTAGLDVTVQRQVLDLMVGLCRDSGASQVLATRDLGIVAQYCNRVAVLDGGRIVEVGPVTEVLLAPRHPATRALVLAAGLQPDAPRLAGAVP
jgi:peptide/nickel transport system permease protein